MMESRARRDRMASLALHSALIVFGAASLIPLLWMVSASFMATGLQPGKIFVGVRSLKSSGKSTIVKSVLFGQRSKGGLHGGQLTRR